MPQTLGVHIGHDGGCAICRDGEILVACAEERLSRAKYANGWWASLRYCLDAVGSDLAAVDLIVFSNSGTPLPEGFDGGLPKWGAAPHRVRTVDHHLSHAIGAFAFSPFDEALVFVGDAGGNLDVTESAFGFGTNGFEALASSGTRPRAEGLGTTYEAFTNFLGFGDQESGKTMALAAYGDGARFPVSLFEVTGRGQIRSNLRSPHQQGVVEFARRAGVDFGSLFPDSASDTAKNVAAYIQREFQTALTDSVLELAARHGAKNVVLSGGIALNCIANSHLRKRLRADSRGFYPFPAGSDSGLSIGNALYGHWLLTGMVPRPVNQSFRFGRDYEQVEIERSLQRHPDTVPVGRLKQGELVFTRTSDAVRDAAELLGRGAIVAWWQGRSETGPRALGGRSILANPTNAEVRTALNSKVKKREWFRPFGPAIISTEAPKYLEGPNHWYPYMIEAPPVLAAARSDFPACVHVDGTARIQTVSPSDTDRFALLLEVLRRQRDNSSVLNTSFNIAEPIVETPGDAIATFLASSIDALVLGDYVCLRKGSRIPSDLPANP